MFRLGIAPSRTGRSGRSIKDGSVGVMLERVIGQIKPETVYFTAIDGTRTGLIFLRSEEASQTQAMCEPFCHGVNAAIDLMPVMTPENVQAGLREAAKRPYERGRCWTRQGRSW
jgi:hypothetical protein